MWFEDFTTTEFRFQYILTMSFSWSICVAPVTLTLLRLPFPCDSLSYFRYSIKALGSIYPVKPRMNSDVVALLLLISCCFPWEGWGKQCHVTSIATTVSQFRLFNCLPSSWFCLQTVWAKSWENLSSDICLDLGFMVCQDYLIFFGFGFYRLSRLFKLILSEVKH